MGFGGLTWKNLPEFQRGLAGVPESADRATRAAVAQGIAAIQRQAQINSAGRPGPNVRTGTHRRGIKTTPVIRVGTFEWGGKVGPTVIYSRRLELGGGNWPAGLKFPYFGPAVAFARNIAIPVIFKRAWEQATRRVA